MGMLKYILSYGFLLFGVLAALYSVWLIERGTNPVPALRISAH